MVTTPSDCLLVSDIISKDIHEMSHSLGLLSHVLGHLSQAVGHSSNNMLSSLFLSSHKLIGNIREICLECIFGRRTS